jgi:hypothetical protein
MTDVAVTTPNAAGRGRPFDVELKSTAARRYAAAPRSKGSM